MEYSLRRALCFAAIVATCAGISTFAQAKIYPIGWDPQFDGTVLIDINEFTCLGTGLQTCQVDLVVADVFDVNTPLIVYHSGPTPNVGDQVLLNANGVPVQFQTFLGQIGVQHTFCDIDCFTDFGTLAFDINFEPSNPKFPGSATLTIDDGQKALSNNYAIPEPGTLGLLLGAIGAGLLAKRRKKAT